MPVKILYADDEENYRKLVKMFLEHAGYEVYTAEDGEEAIEILTDNGDIELVILDILMPGINGRQTCREIRDFSEVPVIMLTALGDEKNEILGIEIGADDYISKPFSNEILLARIGSLLRRSKKTKEICCSEEGIVFLESSNSVKIERKECVLSPKEFDLFRYLVLEKNRVLSRNQILDKVWGYDYFGDPRTVDTHVKSLRAKLQENGERIKTVRNKGYCYLVKKI